MNEKAICDDVIEYHMTQADDLMAHLDRTFWLGNDVPDKLRELRWHLSAALDAVDARLAVKEG